MGGRFHQQSHRPDSAGFTDGIPADIQRESKLQYFNASPNSRLGGLMPVSIRSSPALQNFSVCSCNITREIPAFESCGPISVIELSNNDFLGFLLGSISNCKNIGRIDLESNRLCGNLPDELSGLPVQEFLDVSRNKSKLDDIKLPNVWYNDFSGRIQSRKVFASMGAVHSLETRGYAAGLCVRVRVQWRYWEVKEPANFYSFYCCSPALQSAWSHWGSFPSG